jgi:hypothetical protein
MDAACSWHVSALSRMKLIFSRQLHCPKNLSHMPSLDQAPLDQAAEVAKINQNQVQQEEAQLVETNNNDPLLPKSNIA